MIYLNTFENIKDKIYLVSDIDVNNDKINHFAFYDIESRNNFIINHIHETYKEIYDDEYYEDIKDKFTVEELLKEYNIDESYIELKTVDILENVKLNKDLELKKNTNKFNI